MRSSIASELITVPGTDDVELVVVRLRFSGMNTYVCCLYIPSGSPVAVYHQYASALENNMDFIDKVVDDRLFVLGDFNMTDVCWAPPPTDSFSGKFVSGTVWESNVPLPHNVGTRVIADLLYGLLGAGLSQTNDVRNFQGRILDLVFCSHPSEGTVSKSVCLMARVDDYHVPVEMEFSVTSDDVNEFNPDEHEYNFRKADFDGLNAYLASRNWDNELCVDGGVDAVTDRFYEILSIGFDQFIPVKRRVFGSHRPWYSHSLLCLI